MGLKLTKPQQNSLCQMVNLLLVQDFLRRTGEDMPINAISLRPYNGRNAIRLICASLENAYGDSRWLTRRQAEAQGWRIQEDQEGVKIKFWNADATKGDVPPCKSYSVFNAAQVEGIPPFDGGQKSNAIKGMVKNEPGRENERNAPDKDRAIEKLRDKAGYAKKSIVF
ncbi:hypothetical protein FACS1894204_13830 [Synergistales bacterium]|nr:hypothetical protein FACS1894204_13830 [Synergistales bacterium]